MHKIRDILSTLRWTLFYWPGPSGHYKKRSWPEVELCGKGTAEDPWRLDIVQSNSTRGRSLWFQVVDWVDDRTGHKMCSSRYYSRLWTSVTATETPIGTIPLTEEQVRTIDPDNWHLPENQDEDDDE